MESLFIHRIALRIVICLFLGGTACSNGIAAESSSVSGQAADNQVPDNDTVLDGDIAALKAWALYELGELADANSIARKVLESNPENIIALQIVADIAERDEEWRELAVLWDRVANASFEVGQQEAAAARASQIRDQHASSLQLKGYYGGNAVNDAHTGMLLDTRVVRAAGPDIVASLDTRKFTDEGLFQANSQEQKANTVAVFTFGLAEKRRQIEWDAKLLTSDNTLGTRLGIYRPLSGGRVGLMTHYNVPYLAYREGVADAATVDGIGLHFHQQFSSLILDASVGVAAYNLHDRQRIGESRLGSVALSKILSMQWPNTRLVYVLDAENMIDEEAAARRAQRASSAFRLESREVHSLGVHHRIETSRFKLVNPSTALDLGAGYRSDRLGNQGPFVALFASLPLQRNLDVGLSIDYSISSRPNSSEPSDDYLAAYLDFRWKFAEGEYPQ